MIFLNLNYLEYQIDIKLTDEEKYYDDWPSVNLMIKKDVFNSIGGFNTEHWPGEDTVYAVVKK